jgi:hypothetical protein
MAKINLDIGHALSREDQRRNRRNPCFISQSSLSYFFLRKWRGEVLKKKLLRLSARDLAMLWEVATRLKPARGRRGHIAF